MVGVWSGRDCGRAGGQPSASGRGAGQAGACRRDSLRPAARRGRRIPLARAMGRKGLEPSTLRLRGRPEGCGRLRLIADLGSRVGNCGLPVVRRFWRFPDFVLPTGCPPLSLVLAIDFLRALTGINFAGFDVVEVSSPYDGPGQITSLLAANIAYEMLGLAA